MKKFLIFFTLSIFSISVYGQLGLNARYVNNNASEWTKIISHDLNNDEKIFQNYFEYGLDYWIGMEYVRIEFYPEFSYSRAETEVIVLADDIRTYKQQAISFSAKTNIYPFNLQIDRPCPTNQFINFLQKGLFVQIAPGVSYLLNDYNVDGETIDQQSIAFKVAAGVGFDMRLGDAIFITPYFRFNYFPNAKFEGLSEAHNLDPSTYNNEGSISQTQFGIRIGFVPKYLMRKSTFR